MTPFPLWLTKADRRHGKLGDQRRRAVDYWLVEIMCGCGGLVRKSNGAWLVRVYCGLHDRVEGWT